MTLEKLHKTNLRFVALTILTLMPCIMQAASPQAGDPFDAEHWHAYVVAGVFIATFILLFYNRLYSYKENEVNTLKKSQNARISMIMHAGKLRFWIYEVATRHYKMLSDTGQFTEEYNPIDFARFFDRDDFEAMRAAVFDICENRRKSAIVDVRSNPDNDNVKHYTINLSINNTDSKGQVTHILGVQQDTTNDHEKKGRANEILMRYQTTFNSSLIDLMYFDKDGTLVEINDTACETYRVQDRQQLLDAKPNLHHEESLLNSFSQNEDYTHTTAIIDLANSLTGDEKQPNINGRFYYEYICNTIRNKDGNIEGTYLAGRGITESVLSFHQRKEGAKRLEKFNQDIKEYVKNINYALRASNLLLVNYNPENSMIEISNTIGESRIKLSQLRCVQMTAEKDRKAVIRALTRMDHYTKQNIELAIGTNIRDKDGHMAILMFNLLPMYDQNDKITHYFGTCKNITELVETERLLTIETQKAQEAEKIKEAFLTNMSYEIRTPLSSILGFAKLFCTDHDEADEPIFEEEIKKNTKQLLLLINDILYISRLDADMVEIKKDEVDFASFFESYCHMGWTAVRPEVMTIVENPFERLVIKGDMELIGRVVESFCALASVFTFEGHVLAKCSYNRGELVICIEDTGGGIDKETMNKVFERFTRDDMGRLCGTGLNIPIAYELVKKMGGTVEMQSERGKGTTVWIFLPCEATHIEKLYDI